MKANLTSAADLLGGWAEDVLTGTPPVRYKAPPPFDSLDLRPGRLILTGGAPGQGKTAALMQVAVDLLRLNPAVRVLVANVEMPPAALLERVLARLSSVPLTLIQDRALTEADRERVRVAIAGLTEVAPRLAFLRPPFDMRHVAAAGTVFKANVFVPDYLQRFGTGGAAKDQREQIDGLMARLRQLCDAGALVLAAAAVARQKSRSGASGYTGLNLASYRGSSEVEYGGDACYLLDGDGTSVVLKCEKNRYGEPRDVPLTFEKRFQRFEPGGDADPLKAFDAAAPAPTPRQGGKGKADA